MSIKTQFLFKQCLTFIESKEKSSVQVVEKSQKKYRGYCVEQKAHTSDRQLQIQKKTGLWGKVSGPQENMRDWIWLPGTRQVSGRGEGMGPAEGGRPAA
jgi:hypothetical protein